MGLMAWFTRWHRHPQHHGDNGSTPLKEAVQRLQQEAVNDDREERERFERRLHEARRQVELERRLMMRRSTDRRPHQ